MTVGAVSNHRIVAPAAVVERAGGIEPPTFSLGS